MTLELWVFVIVGVFVGCIVISEKREYERIRKLQRKAAQERARDDLEKRQEASYYALRASKRHLLDRSVESWASSVDRAPTLQRRASLKVLKGAKR